eukprot:UN11276
MGFFENGKANGNGVYFMKKP